MGPEFPGQPRPAARPEPLRSVEPYAAAGATFQRGAERRDEVHGQGDG